VFIGDPVANGLVDSLSRPGGNVTGVSNLNAVIESKRLGLLRELVPQAGMVGALQNPDSPTAATQQKDLEEAARAIGLQIRFWQASTELELEATFEARRTHAIPEALSEPPEHWSRPYEVMAKQVGLEANVKAGHARASKFIDPILRGRSQGRWDPEVQEWRL